MTSQTKTIAPAFALDQDIAFLCDHGAELEEAATLSGFTFDQAMAMYLERSRQVREAMACGYLATPKRARSARAAAIAAGVRTPPPRETKAQRDAKTSAAFFGPRRLLACEVAA